LCKILGYPNPKSKKMQILVLFFLVPDFSYVTMHPLLLLKNWQREFFGDTLLLVASTPVTLHMNTVETSEH